MITDATVEAAARAIARLRGGKFAGPGQSFASREFGWRGDGWHLDKYADAHWMEHEDEARAAIDAAKTEIAARMADVMTLPQDSAQSLVREWLGAGGDAWVPHIDSSRSRELIAAIERLVNAAAATGTTARCPP